MHIIRHVSEIISALCRNMSYEQSKRCVIHAIVQSLV